MNRPGGPLPDRATAAVLSQLATPVVLVHPDGRPAYCNPAAERLLAAPGGETQRLPGPLEALVTRAGAEDRSFTAHDLRLPGPGQGQVHLDAVVTPLDRPGGGLALELFPHDHRRETGEALMAQHGAAPIR